MCMSLIRRRRIRTPNKSEGKKRSKPGILRIIVTNFVISGRQLCLSIEETICFSLSRCLTRRHDTLSTRESYHIIMSYQGIISPQTFIWSIVAVYNVFHSHRIHIFPTIKHIQYAIFSNFFVQRNIRVICYLNYDSNICLYVSENEEKYLWHCKHSRIIRQNT